MITNELAEINHNLGSRGVPRDCGRHRFVKGSVFMRSELPLPAGSRKMPSTERGRRFVPDRIAVMCRGCYPVTVSPVQRGQLVVLAIPAGVWWSQAGPVGRWVPGFVVGGPAAVLALLR